MSSDRNVEVDPNAAEFGQAPGVTRRQALTSLGALGGLGAAATALAQDDVGAIEELRRFGWDAEAGEYTLPPLPYAYNALEPHIDEETMRIHHDKHHAGYVRGANNALTRLAEIRAGAGDPGLIKHWSRELAFHSSGNINHAYFWRVMAPPSEGGGGQPGGALARQIRRDFGSFRDFSEHFQAASRAVEGSGWGWLVWEPLARKLMVIQAEKHQDLSVRGAQPLMGVDVWEHAYYLKYQNRRGDYVAAFMNVVNWPFVSRLFESIAS